MPAKPVNLAGIHFAKKADAVSYLNEMLYKYDLGDKVNSEDAKVLLAALNRHPDASEKIGPGVAGFSVRTADFRTRCFWVNRTDGSTEKFSHRTCIYGS